MAGFHNNDYFVLKNQLDAETRQKLHTLVPTLGACEDDVVERIFVTEWTSDMNSIYALGCDVNGRTVKLPVNVSPGVFAISSNVPLLRSVCALHGCQLEVHEGFAYRCNNFAPWDLLIDPNYADRESVLVKICASSVAHANELFYKFRREEESYRYVSVPLYWSPTKQILFERLIKYCRDNGCITYNLPRITMRWFDSKLNCYEFPEPTLPIITFDIETVSTDANRMPYGDHADDELFTVSVHHTHTNTLYTLVYLPLDDGTSVEAMKRRILADSYPTYPELQDNRLECFATERDLLIRTMELLTLPNGRMHILVGYNSMSYDIKYLFLRCAFYNLELHEQFVYREGYAYGFSQIHLDLFRIIMSQYRLKNYTLNSVSQFLLKETKTGVDAVKLRYTFHAIRHHKCYFEHDECVKWPSIRDTLHYNNYDTILVSKLLERANSIEFTLNQAHECRIALSALNSNYNKMRFKLWSRCFVVGLEIGIFQSTFKSSNALFRVPLHDPEDGNSAPDYIELRVPLGEQLQGEPINSADRMIPYKFQLNDILTKRKAKYPGGANFCLGEYVVDDVQMLDYRIAYPLLIDRQNISDETATILPANLIHMYLARMPRERWKAFRTFDYMTHTGANKSETSILYHQYIYEGLYCGGEFACTLEELGKRGDSPVVMIWQGRRGILSDIIMRFNTLREDTKNKRKLLDGVIALLDDRIGEIMEEMRLLREEDEKEEEESGDSGNGNGHDSDDDDGCFGIETNSENEEDRGDEKDDDDDGWFGMNAESDEGKNGGDGGDDDDEYFDVESDHERVCDEQDTKPDTKTDQRLSDDEKPENPFDFKFVNSFVTIHANRTIELNESALLRLDYEERIAVLEDLKRNASTERDGLQNRYELLKTLVASIYGCVGTSSPVCAALITYAIRSLILQAARYVVLRGYVVYYIDTDSLSIKHPTETCDISPELNHHFPDTEIEMKPYSRCMFVQKKTYYSVAQDGSLKYFQHVNGNPEWRDFVQYVYRCGAEARTNDDVYKLFTNFYESVYDRLLAFSSITPELKRMISQEVKVKAVYKTNTHLAKLKLYLQKRYPALAGSYRQTVYYVMKTDIKQTVFRPIVHLTSVTDLATVNMFKFYQNVFKTVFNLIKFHLRRNNEPFVITISPRQILLSMINAYLDVHARRFPESSVSAQSVIASHDIDEYDFLADMQNDSDDEAEYEKTLTNKRKHRELTPIAQQPPVKLRVV